METITPKQDAEALFNSMKGFRVKHSHVRKCANIVCDTLINEYKYKTDDLEFRLEHWQQVKIELANCGKQ